MRDLRGLQPRLPWQRGGADAGEPARPRRTAAQRHPRMRLPTTTLEVSSIVNLNICQPALGQCSGLSFAQIPRVE